MRGEARETAERVCVGLSLPLASGVWRLWAQLGAIYFECTIHIHFQNYDAIFLGETRRGPRCEERGLHDCHCTLDIARSTFADSENSILNRLHG